MLITRGEKRQTSTPILQRINVARQVERFCISHFAAFHNPEKWTNERTNRPTNEWVTERQIVKWTKEKTDERRNKLACERTNKRRPIIPPTTNARANELTYEKTKDRTSDLTTNARTNKRANERTLGHRNEQYLYRFPGIALHLVANKNYKQIRLCSYFFLPLCTDSITNVEYGLGE